METLPLEFGGYKPGEKLGGIALEYESSMVRQYYREYFLNFFSTAYQVHGGYRARCDSPMQSKSQESSGQNFIRIHWSSWTYILASGEVFE